MSTKLPAGHKVIGLKHEHASEATFSAGVFEHYKGGLYYAMALAWANEVSEPHERVVVYLSLTTGEWHTRPFSSDIYDAWNDSIHIEVPNETYKSHWVRRFQYVGPQPIPT